MVTDGLFQQEMLDLEIRNNYLCTWYCSPVALVPYRLTVEHLRPSELRTKTGTDGTRYVVGKPTYTHVYSSVYEYCDWQKFTTATDFA